MKKKKELTREEVLAMISTDEKYKGMKPKMLWTFLNKNGNLYSVPDYLLEDTKK